MSTELEMGDKVMQDTQLARLLYVAHGATFLLSLGLLSFIPLFINYIKRDDTRDSLVYSHHNWMIRSFWIYVALMAGGIVMMFTIILIPLAWLVFCGAWLWKAYRLIKGFIDLNSGRVMQP